MDGRTVAGLAGFVALGLSPSFIDWQQSSGSKRAQIAAYYAVALVLIWFGIFRGR